MHSLTFPLTNPEAIFALILLIVLLAPIFSEKVKIPSIVGLIFAGIIFGPNVLGVIVRDNAIELLAAIGLLYIMFLSGLEIEMEDFKRKRNHSLIFGIFTFIIPLIFGTLGGYYLLNLNIPQSVLLASMFSSHTLLTFPMISKFGLAKRGSVVTGVGGTIITDTLAILILAVITGGETGSGGLMFWLTLTILSTGFVIVMFTIVPAIGKWFFKNVNSDGFTEFVFIMAVLFISSTIAHLVGLEPIIGAFMAGLTLNRLIPEKSILMNRIKFVGNSMFIPFFLISVGMLINPGLILKGGAVIKVSAVMVVIALVSKYMAALISGKMLKFNKHDISLLFGLSVNQAAATLAAVLVGYRLGLFDDNIITGTIVMILVTCSFGAWITANASKKIIIADENSLGIPEEVMQRILIPVYNNKTASELMNLAFLLRTASSKEPVYPVTIVDAGDNIEAQIAKGEKMLAPLVVQSIAADVPVTPLTRAENNPVTGIVKAAVDVRASDIVIGWTEKSGIYSSVVAGVMDRLIKQTKQMLFISRLLTPINVTTRVILMLPALIEKHTGFEKTAVTISNLTSQLAASLYIISDNESLTAFKKILSKHKIALQTENFITSDWRSAFVQLKNIAKTDDFIAFISLRTGEIGWQPALERLPKKIISDFKAHNFALIYPEMFRRGSGAIVKETEIPEILHAIDFADFKLSSSDIKTAIKYLISKIYKGDIADSLTAEMSRVSYEEPVELCDGVILLHAHIDSIDQYRIFFGVNKKGFDLPSVSGKPAAFFMLVAPKSQSPEKHLSILGAVAKLVQNPEFANFMMEAKSLEDFKRFFRK